ncbi:DNA polymerase III subunit alpha [Paenibacillus sp. LHD-117]|uniref:DNA polymerase III subunit alpha n=1 Tax=Paenibacillus sp. LHD-117 TaxID=3071412 RepID=UPI0027E0CD36|nr:DNA polymerase III subunit alpha [Paenibacillus sp. LHD-117]MDQ6422339.1 DNA polymerase III subunit alpha [Paenibacillus sp. LHD-117]
MAAIGEASFVHLHAHSEYSLLDGAARIRELTARAAELGMKALALTDHGVMYGAIPFYRACMANGIKPIIGCEFYLTAGSRHEKGARKDNPTYHLILLAKNEAGYRNVMKLCSIGHLEGFHYKPRIDMESLASHSEGLICLSSCLKGEVSQHLLFDRREDAKAAALRYKEIFGDDFYLELQDHGMLEQKKVAGEMIGLARELGIKLVATNDVHYLRPEDAEVQDVLICIGTGKTVEDGDRLRIGTNQLYMKSAGEMEALFRHVPEAIAHTVEIADKCELQLTLGRAALPTFRPVPEGSSSSRYLADLCKDGLMSRYAGVPAWTTDESFCRKAEERLDYELSVIDNMGFSDYFLIVWDFIRFAHERGIRTGPGRGSSAGSLVAYTLRITDVDPLKYKLLFERFLNPERITMPDIDIDFNDERRDEVISYVAAKYGEEHVAQIITFGTMAAKAAVRDVGRALNVPFQEVDRAAKLIPGQLGITLEEAIRTSGELRDACERQPKTDALLRMAMKVEGMPRHASTHAAGVVIAKEPLTQYVPLQQGGESIPLTQYSMEHLEAIGLLKMDFLGLRTLSILERTLGWIKELAGKEIDFRSVSDADPETYAMLGRGDTTGIFQLESAGVRRVLRELKPTAFEDIISVLALYRPGPMEFIPKYIAGKHGKEAVDYPHESLEPILADTYGIIVYQEQIMQIASLMAGFSLGEADLLRRAVSKKKREVLDEERGHFVKGSLSQGYGEVEANRVYDMIVRFADYGFPRAHAAAYGVLAFQTAWLKAHYPVPFMASMLASVTGNMRKTAEYADECRRMGITVLPPDVNESGASFTPVGGSVRFGLASVKNVGTQAIEAIRKERAAGPYASLLDLCKRVDLRVVNKRVLESLIQAGACDSLPGHRAQLLAALEETVETAQKWRKEREELQIELFGFEEVQNWDVELPEIREFTTAQKLDFERELLGMYLSGHPLDHVSAQLEGLELDRLVELTDAPDGYVATVGVMVAGLKPFTNKKGNAMGFLELEDRIMRVEAVVFPAVWKRCGGKLEREGLAIVQATVQQQDDDYKLLVEDVVPIGPEHEAASLAAQVKRLRQQARNRASRSAGAAGGQALPPAAGGGAPQSRAGGAGPIAEADRAPRSAYPSGGGRPQNAPSPAADARARNAGSAQSASGTGGFSGAPDMRKQRMYIKITAEKERSDVLNKLKQALVSHPGRLDTALFYEGDGKVIALSDSHRVTPSPELKRLIERLLGPDTVVIK